MINKIYCCNICDKYISKKNCHNKTKVHTQLSLRVVNKYNINDIPVNEIDNTINKYVYDCKKNLSTSFVGVKYKGIIFVKKLIWDGWMNQILKFKKKL